MNTILSKHNSIIWITCIILLTMQGTLWIYPSVNGKVHTAKWWNTKMLLTVIKLTLQIPQCCMTFRKHISQNCHQIWGQAKCAWHSNFWVGLFTSNEWTYGIWRWTLFYTTPCSDLKELQYIHHVSESPILTANPSGELHPMHAVQNATNGWCTEHGLWR